MSSGSRLVSGSGRAWPLLLLPPAAVALRVVRQAAARGVVLQQQLRGKAAALAPRGLLVAPPGWLVGLAAPRG